MELKYVVTVRLNEAKWSEEYSRDPNEYASRMVEDAVWIALDDACRERMVGVRLDGVKKV